MADRRTKRPEARKSTLPRGLLSRLTNLMAEQNMTRKALSLKAGLSETYMSDLLQGKNNSPSIPVLINIAKVLGTSVAYLLGETYHEENNGTLRAANLMPLVGIVESGAFRKLPQGEPELVSRPKSKHYPSARHFALYVNDSSMSAAPEQSIQPGMEVVCIDIDDANLEIESGRIYALRRTRDGETYETLLRRAMVYRDRVELTAESGKPAEYEKIVHTGRLTSDRSQSLYAFGLVCGSFQSFE